MSQWDPVGSWTSLRFMIDKESMKNGFVWRKMSKHGSLNRSYLNKVKSYKHIRRTIVFLSVTRPRVHMCMHARQKPTTRTRQADVFGGPYGWRKPESQISIPFRASSFVLGHRPCRPLFGSLIDLLFYAYALLTPRGVDRLVRFANQNSMTTPF